MTAVEWLTNELKKGWTDEEIEYIFKLFEQAKEMERIQMQQSFQDGQWDVAKHALDTQNKTI